MNRFVRYSVLACALTLGLVFSSSAFADTLTWSITGTNETGSGSFTATNEGAGLYLVTGMTGNITVNGFKETVSGFSQITGKAGTTTDDGIYTYDDLLNLGSSSLLDSYGIVFSLSGALTPFNICAGASAGCNSSGSGTFFDNSLYGIGNAIQLSVKGGTTSAPEPSALASLALGVLALAFIGGRRGLFGNV